LTRLDHASRLAASWLADADAPAWREADGSWVLVDLSGFTRHTERLASTGAEGVEVLHQALTRCFAALLGPSTDLGGDVLGFAGDAALVYFDGAGHVARAVDAASSMSPLLAAVPATLTGGRRLQVSIGVHTAAMTALLAGSGQQCLFLCGPEMSLLARLQAAAPAGRVLVSDAVAAMLDANRRGAATGPGVELVGAAAGNRSRADTATLPGYPVEVSGREPSAESSYRLLSPAVRDLIQADAAVGDHRAVSVGFVMITGLDALLAAQGPGAIHPMLVEVVDTCVRVGAELSIDLLDSDVGVDSVKLLLAAGAPRAVDNDEGRMLLALRRIVDGCTALMPSGVTVRAGTQRGPVYAGRLGVPGRTTYTVLGDPVNVAARALTAAAAGDVVAGDGMGVAGRAEVVAVSLGATSLRNRVRPVELWRVDSVGRSPTTVRGELSASIDIARGEEWTTVISAWKQAENGIGEATAVAGSAATLLDADPFARHVPYGLVVALVRSLAVAAGGDVSDGGWSWLLHHRAQVPDHLRSWVDDAVAVARGRMSSSAGDPRTRATRAHRALAAVLAAAAPRPWMLAIDDVDAVDESSRSVLDGLGELTVGESILLLTGSRSVTFRSSGSPVVHAVIELLPVGDATATALVRAAAPLLRPDQVVRILAAGKGNPFVVTELARHSTADELPDSLQRLGAVLIDALPVAMRSLVRDAATLGPTVSLDVMADVLGRPELADPATWRTASSVVSPSGDGSLAFVHDVYRTVAHESLSFHRRRELHGAIADHMVRHDAPDTGTVALHLQLAGRYVEALPMAQEAGLRAKSAGALAEANELLGHAAAMARATRSDQLTLLLLEHGETLSWLGDLVGAEQAYRCAARRRPSPDEHARLCHLVADHALRTGEYRRMNAWIQRGLVAVESGDEAGGCWRCELLLDEASRHSDLGRQLTALRSSEEALGIAERLGNVTLQGKAHLSLEISYSILMDEAAIAHGDAAVLCFERAGNDRHLASAYNNIALTSMHLGRWGEAFDRYARARAHGAHAGRPLDVAIVDTNVGFMLYRQGHHEEADVLARSALHTCAVVGARRQVAFARVLQGLVAGGERHFAEAEQHVALARAEFAEMGDAALVVDCDTIRMAHLLTQGRSAEVLFMAPEVERRLGAAEVEVVISFDRTVGHARTLAGESAGIEQVRRGLLVARGKRMVYDEYLCLATLSALSAALSSREAARVRDARDVIAEKLGIVRNDG